MRESYDFSDSQSNPYIKDLKKSVTIRLGVDVVEYFKTMSKETGIPYQNLINLYLSQLLTPKGYELVTAVSNATFG